MTGSKEGLLLGLGDLVEVHNKLATVKYLGTSPKSKKPVVGVEFVHYQKGDSDGTLEGERKFIADKNCGTFVDKSEVKQVDPKWEAAAVVVQKYFRGALARQSVTAQATFAVWNALESQKEGETLEMGKTVTKRATEELQRQLKAEEDAHLASIPEDSGGDEDEPNKPSRKSSAGSLAKRLSRRMSSVQSISSPDKEIDERYKGPQLKWPIQRSFGLELLDVFRENPDVPLPAKYAWDLMIAMEEHLTETVPGGVLHVEFPKRTDSRIVVVGDTHGQLNDVLWIFYKFGPPSPTNIYLFNGDIADRGVHAVEIFMLLFAFKLAHPECVIINRGNHESADLNEVYGFAAEVRSKYCGKIYSKFQDIFNVLPLCIVIEKRIAVVHGGLFRRDNVTLEQINNIDRKRPCPVSPRSADDTLMFDILWSDPQHEPGRGLSTRGVDCISFGHDVTANFLALNGLEVCIRSHQVPVNLRGFEPLHEGYCVTLFSASNYCGTTGNFGGVIIFEPDMAFEIQEYMAPSLEDIKLLHRETQQATKKVRTHAEVFKDIENRARVRNRRSSVVNMQRDVLKKIGRMICQNKEALFEKFREHDKKSTGRVTAAQWRAVCGEVMGSKLPWMFVQKRLRLAQTVTAPATEGREKGTAPRKGDKETDRDRPEKKSGLVSRFTPKATDRSSKGKEEASSPRGQAFVDYSAFLQRFRVEFRPIGSQHGNWRRETVQQVFESILEADLSLKETLMVFDRNCDGTVSHREFHELLTELNLGLTEPQVRLLMRVITSNHAAANDPAGRIDAAEFLGRFRVVYGHAVQERAPREKWVTSALEEIGKRILVDRKETAQRHYENQQPLMYDPQSRRRSSAVRAVALFQKFKEYNEAGDGYLSYDDFVTSIQKLPGFDAVQKKLDMTLDKAKIVELATTIDVTGSGKINYLEFLDAFHVVDARSTSNNLADEMWSFICEVMLRAKDSVTQTLFESDPTQSGRADLDDFRDAMMAVNDFIGDKQPLTAEQIDSVVNCVDTDEEGLLNYDDFFDSFHVVDTQADSESDNHSDMDPAEREEIQSLLFEEFAVEKNLRRKSIYGSSAPVVPEKTKSIRRKLTPSSSSKK